MRDEFLCRENRGYRQVECRFGLLIGSAELSLDPDVVVVDQVGVELCEGSLGNAAVEYDESALADHVDGLRLVDVCRGRGDDLVSSLAVRKFLDFFDRIDVRVVDDDVHAELLRHFQSVLVDVDHDDLLSAAELRELRHEVADRACADDDDRVRESYLRVLHGGVDGSQGLCQAGCLVGYAFRNLIDVAVVDLLAAYSDILSESADTGKLRNVLVLAVLTVSAYAGFALHAVGARVQEQSLSDLVLGAFRTNFVHDANDLMTVNERIVAFSGIGGQVADIGAAQSDRHDLQDQTVFRAGWFFSFFYTDIIWAVHHCSFHCFAHGSFLLLFFIFIFIICIVDFAFPAMSVICERDSVQHFFFRL